MFGIIPWPVLDPRDYKDGIQPILPQTRSWSMLSAAQTVQNPYQKVYTSWEPINSAIPMQHISWLIHHLGSCTQSKKGYGLCYYSNSFWTQISILWNLQPPFPRVTPCNTPGALSIEILWCHTDTLRLTADLSLHNLNPPLKNFKPSLLIHRKEMWPATQLILVSTLKLEANGAMCYICKLWKVLLWFYLHDKSCLSEDKPTWWFSLLGSQHNGIGCLKVFLFDLLVPRTSSPNFPEEICTDRKGNPNFSVSKV